MMKEVKNKFGIILLSMYIFYEGYRHIFQPPEISSIPKIN